MGDPSKLILLESVLEVIQQDNLLDRVARVGDYTLKQLMTMQRELPDVINSARGRGTFIAFDCATSELRDSIVKKLLSKGRKKSSNPFVGRNIF